MEVEESNYESIRKRRSMVFNLKEKTTRMTRQIVAMIRDMGVRKSYSRCSLESGTISGHC